MFEPSKKPRVFSVNLGIDYPKAIVGGILSRMESSPASELARVTILVNTQRMSRRLKDLFISDDARLLPKIQLITDLSKDPTLLPSLEKSDALGHRLQIAQLVRALIDSEEGIAPRSAAFDLADSLADLMDEMHAEGIDPERLESLDVADHSEYWARSLKFINLVEAFFGEEAKGSQEAIQRYAVKSLVAKWAKAPPQSPILVVGSTGSRATTRLLMEAVSKLPQGAVILPGFDESMTAEHWQNLTERSTSEDHPQYRFKAFADALEMEPNDIESWGAGETANPARNALLSLALRPAPVTHMWLSEGPKLRDLDTALKDVTLLEAPNPRIEALSIAVGIREALELEKSVALITPDRLLTRQVAAALQRWNILPDDSAGLPLNLSAPGRLLRQTANLLGERITSQDLLALLKHPLVSAQSRNGHLLNTRDLELEVLRGGPPFPVRADLTHWAENRATRSDELLPWVVWVADLIEEFASITAASTGELFAAHMRLTQQAVGGLDNSGHDMLWGKEAGKQAKIETDKLKAAAHLGGTLTPREYRDVFGAVISKGEVRDATTPNPNVMIWGTLESRVQGADLIIMAGLNDGVWPGGPRPDPWLNRKMRQEAGLLLPEREIGLAAHDFQQAAAAKEIWLSRSVRDVEAETVPSRWLNRLRNLLTGVSEESAALLKEARNRGDSYIDLAAQLEAVKEPVPPAKRPSPQPPLLARPTKLAVTRIEKLIRDPYAIYARYILGLTPLRDLVASPDAPMRGLAVHEIMEEFVHATKDGLGPDPLGTLMRLADEVFEQAVPWPATRHMWRAKLRRVAPWFIECERMRRATAAPMRIGESPALEVKVSASIVSPSFTLEGRIDRVDQHQDGRLALYDYKTGGMTSVHQQKHFDKQLELLAALVHRNGIGGHTGFQVASTTYIGLGSTPKESKRDYTDEELEAVWEKFEEIIRSYASDEAGYTARRAVFEERFEQDYDHLARFGEWSQTDHPHPEKVGQ